MKRNGSGIKVRSYSRRMSSAEQLLGDGIKARRGTNGETARQIADLTPAQTAIAFRGTCPACQATIVAMSEISVNEPTATAPKKGDVIRCEACGRHSAIKRTDARRRMRLELIELAES